MTCVRTDIHMVEQNEEISINNDHSLLWHPQKMKSPEETCSFGSDNRSTLWPSGHGKFPEGARRGCVLFFGECTHLWVFESKHPTWIRWMFSSLFRLPRLFCFFSHSGFAGVCFHDSHWAPIRIILSVVCWGACWTAIYRLLQMETQSPFFYSPPLKIDRPKRKLISTSNVGLMGLVFAGFPENISKPTGLFFLEMVPQFDDCAYFWRSVVQPPQQAPKALLQSIAVSGFLNRL